MNNNIIERVKILFFGSKVSHAKIICITQSAAETQDIKFHETDEPEGLKIVGVEIVSESFMKHRVIDAIKTDHPDSISGYYFFTRKQKHIRAIEGIIEELSLGTIETYGIDPDYYFSFVPLRGENHKMIERYILDLKNDYSTAGLIKHFIKRLLINMNLSGRLYEGYVVAVSRNSKGLH